MTAPSRRWFRFSLRTMFVVVTAFCLWLGWNVNTVQQRSRLREKITANNTGVFRLDDYLPQAGWPAVEKRWTIDSALAKCSRRAEPQRIAPPSRIRRWLGDEQAYVLVLTEESDFESARSCFPEATILLVSESFKENRFPGRRLTRVK